MSDITCPYYSYGTIYGTLRNYDNDGNDIGPRDITDYGIFFSVKTKFASGGTRVIYKTIGSGIDIEAGTGGNFNIYLQSSDLALEPNEYAWGCFINPYGTVYFEGTTDVKWIGGGKFIVNQGIKVQ